jgi:hypothetical protein
MKDRWEFPPVRVPDPKGAGRVREAAKLMIGAVAGVVY